MKLFQQLIVCFITSVQAQFVFENLFECSTCNLKIEQLLHSKRAFIVGNAIYGIVETMALSLADPQRWMHQDT